MQKNSSIFIAEKSDLPKILELYNAHFSPWKMEELSSLFENGAKCILHVIDKEIVGFLLYRTIFNETEIISVAVDKKFQNQGIGGKLLSHLFQSLQSPAYVFLEVRPSNKSAVALYEKFGMKQINVRKNYYNNPVEDALIYQKNV